MLGEATLDTLGTFLGEAIRLLILFAAQQKKENTPPRDPVRCEECLLDRGWGRPTQPLAGDPEEPPVGIELSDEERRRRAREEIDRAFPERARGD
jgi:hypothetical protein